MPRIPNSKRGWEGGEVRAYPTSVDPFKRTVKEQHPAIQLKDDASADEEEKEEKCKLEDETLLKGKKEAEDKSEPTSPLPTADCVAADEPSSIENEPDNFSVCVVGAGGIGCHLAYVLHKAGARVTLIARGENLRVLQNEGLHITICGEEVGPVFIPATDDPHSIGNVDYIFLTMKVSGYDSNVLDTISPLVGPQTTILPPTTSIPYWWFHRFGGHLSGKRLHRVDPEDKLWTALPPEKVIGFTMWLSAAQVGPGRTVLRHVQRGYPFGELDGSSSKRVQRLAAAIEKGGIPAPQVPDIRSEIFIKSINSLAFNIVAVLGDAVNGTIAEVPEAVDTLRQVMAECELIAHKLDIPIRQDAESRIRQTLSAHMHTMSMLHDLRSGKKLELRPLWESVSNLAEAVEVELPITKALVSCALLREKAASVRREADSK
jgi:2-dehydropantoate 2-reductase